MVHIGVRFNWFIITDLKTAIMFSECRMNHIVKITKLYQVLYPGVNHERGMYLKPKRLFIEWAKKIHSDYMRLNGK